LWTLDACVKAGVLVGHVCLMATLKEYVRRFSKVPASQRLEQAGNWAKLTVLKVLRRRLRLVQALTPADKVKRREF
jgi:hypothetical protein